LLGLFLFGGQGARAGSPMNYPIATHPSDNVAKPSNPSSPSKTHPSLEAKVHPCAPPDLQGIIPLGVARLAAESQNTAVWLPRYL